MAETTIEWTSYQLPDGTWIPGYTFNHVRGCTKVSPGCENCYAEKMSGRNPGVLGDWGKGGTRVIAKEAYWRQPLKWNAEAQKDGHPRLVFCASLADVFEGKDTMPPEAWEDVEAARSRLFSTIEVTPWLRWLLLTKRPENIVPTILRIKDRWGCNGFPGVRTGNIVLMTSVEDQPRADIRIPQLLSAARELGGVMTGLSCEPLLGPVDLYKVPYMRGSAMIVGDEGGWEYVGSKRNLLHWVIVGGESGPNARPMHPEWVRSLRDQCVAAGVPFHFKQWGEWAPVSSSSYAGSGREKSQHIAMLRDGRIAYEDKGPAFGSVVSDASAHRLVDREMSKDENLRKKLAKTGLFPGMKAYHEQRGESFAFDRIGYQWMARLGKKESGRHLDGREWSEFPKGLIG